MYQNFSKIWTRTRHHVKNSKHEHDINMNSHANFVPVSFRFVTYFCVISKIATYMKTLTEDFTLCFRF